MSKSEATMSKSEATMSKSSGNFMVDAEDNSEKCSCDYCNGTGEIADMFSQSGTRECPECEGRGYYWS